MRTGEEIAGDWDAVIVGGGHNGLTAAAYLARASLRVLVLERRAEVGGAATREHPFEDPSWVVSPCAYLVGLLHPLVVAELDLDRWGYKTVLVDPHLWCPFDDGTSLALWDDAHRSAGEIARLAPGDVDGYLAYDALFARIRHCLRGTFTEVDDLWLGDAPDRGDVEKRLGGDREAIETLFEASIAEVVERHVRDERLRTALHGQGLIGTWAGPRDRGTAAIHAMHSSGRLEGVEGAWGYVQGGMGRVSLALAAAARDAGAVVVTGVEVSSIEPAEGVVLDGGDNVSARVVISNADPKRTLALVAGEVPTAWRDRIASWRSESPVVKVNCGLSALPRFHAASDPAIPHRAMVTISGSINQTQAAYDASRRGEVAPGWCEVYFPTAYDPTIAPPGLHQMSVFAQYAPYSLAEGTWADRREEIGDMVLAEIDRFAPGITSLVVERQVLGPPDVEERIGLTGGHIFQGECLPDQMWDRRFSPRTPVEGLYLCGAATHPGGSVIAANGRNAAMAVLADRSRRR